MKVARWIIVSIFVSTMAYGQARPEFEVASIKPSAEQPTGQAEVGLHIDGAQVRCAYLSLKNYIVLAYRLKDYQVIGPEWLGTQKFDISAKLPDGALATQVPEMLQALLAERFKLTLHHDTKEFPVYTLEVLKGGAKLTALPDTDEPDSADKGNLNISAGGNAKGLGVNMGGGSYYSLADNKFEGKKLTMAVLAGGLSRFTDRPVVDNTRLPGRYDIALEVSTEDYRAMLVQSAINAGVTLPPQAMRALDFASGDAFGNSLEKLGLKMQSGKAPLDVVVIDNMLKTPTDK